MTAPAELVPTLELPSAALMQWSQLALLDGAAAASARTNQHRRSPGACCACCSIPAEMSTPITVPRKPTRAATARAASPVPVATSRIRWPGASARKSTACSACQRCIVLWS